MDPTSCTPVLPESRIRWVTSRRRAKFFLFFLCPGRCSSCSSAGRCLAGPLTVHRARIPARRLLANTGSRALSLAKPPSPMRLPELGHPSGDEASQKSSALASKIGLPARGRFHASRSGFRLHALPMLPPSALPPRAFDLFLHRRPRCPWLIVVRHAAPQIVGFLGRQRCFAADLTKDPYLPLTPLCTSQNHNLIEVFNQIHGNLFPILLK